MSTNIRTFTISGISGRYNESFPFIRIRGKWLKSVGFNCGDKIQVQVEHERLIITKKLTPEENKA